MINYCYCATFVNHGVIINHSWLTLVVYSPQAQAPHAPYTSPGLQAGACKRGSACNFAHDDVELKEMSLGICSFASLGWRSNSFNSDWLFYGLSGCGLAFVYVKVYLSLSHGYG